MLASVIVPDILRGMQVLTPACGSDKADGKGGSMREVMFGGVTVIASYLIYVLPLSVLSHLIYGSVLFRPEYILLAVLCAAPVLYYLRTHSTSAILSGFTHYGMGVGFIGLMVGLSGLMLAALMPDYRTFIGQACAVLIVSLSLLAIIRGRQVTVKRLTFSSAKLKRQKRLVFISDVHLGSNPRTHLETLCSHIGGLDYDYLLIGGDLFDSSAFRPDELQPLRQLKTPIFFVTGNHEYYVRNHQDKLATLADYHITTLDNQSHDCEGIRLVGIADNQPPARQAEIARQLVSDSQFTIVMVHQPAIWEDVPDNVDLMLSGHTHNGQIFPFNVLVRLQFKAVYGLYKRGMSQLYVSSGSGTWGPRMRLGTRNEIIHITLKPAHQTGKP